MNWGPPLRLVNDGRRRPDSGRDLALLRVNEGLYPAITLSTRDSQIGDPVHILGFPGVVLSHELLNRSVTLEASVTDRKSTRLNSSHLVISYAVFCLKKKTTTQ